MSEATSRKVVSYLYMQYIAFAVASLLALSHLSTKLVIDLNVGEVAARIAPSLPG